MIERAYRAGLTQRQIAAVVGKHHSTISRELSKRFPAPGVRSPRRSMARGGGLGYERVYNAANAQRHAAIKARRPKARRLDHAPLRDKVWELLRADWSPKQISRWLPGQYPKNERMRVSHETIYQSLFVQTKGELKRELT
ncbi:helix-turn-helix domain-containing protein, partial [Nocardioides sp. C4-1]|uniref:helix-turn-helix domain-containing protein n=1 Tax=Nocardioides sp. C4-1 TaxID=3151851 RepID=UPI003265AA8A